MIMSLFAKSAVRDEAVTLYSAAVDQARKPIFYADFGVDDTVEGRFELIALHVFLIMRALKGRGERAAKLSQAIIDVMFQNMDDSLRELGVGDLSVGRKIRKLAESFYGRVNAYEAALASESGAGALARALARNVYEQETAPSAPALAAYARAAAATLAAQPIDELVSASVAFPPLEEKP